MINLWVAVPVYNEQHIITDLMERLRLILQHDAFHHDSFQVVLCDNGSTDDTKQVMDDFVTKYGLNWHVIIEPEKGTGAAADTAIRYAIKEGASHVARTDADCLPAVDWVKQIRWFFERTNLRFIAGRITSRMDDTDITNRQANIFNAVVPLAAAFGRFRPMNQGKQYKGPYVMTAGCNMAIESQLYVECGGFPRTKIEDVHEDHVIINNVRKVTGNYGYRKDVHVEVSARRIAEWGVVNTLKWYANHSYRPEVTDIR